MGVPGRFSRDRAESERFNAALGNAAQHSAAQHSAAADGTALDNTAASGDAGFAAELAVVAGLRSLGEAGVPDAETRERIRTEIADRLGEPVAPPVRRRWNPRMADLVAAGIALVLGLVGLTLLLSRGAVPGDALYGVKRAGEETALGLTFGAEAKAHKHLEFAANRVAELGRMTDATPAAYRTALADFGSDVRAGVTTLTMLATGGSGRAQLSDLQRWTRQQERLLVAEQARVPASARADVSDARGLLTRVQRRTSALASRLNCYEITTGSSDELGVIPADGACTQQPARPGASAPASPAPATSLPSLPPVPGSPVPETPAPSPDLAVSSTPAGPPPESSTTPPPVFAPPIPTPTGPRLTTPTSPPPPVISVPPLLPGLPPIVVG
ncbi:MAG TPA: DUF5667 domain-containing protein [Amycolatopsis sp.]|nr:DUF5667 domain-containing protein [Amycolatopsis sp.]